MATGSLYDIKQLQIEEEDVLVEAGGKSNWSALSSALQTNVSYEFVSDQPFEYMDFRQRYLVRKVADANNNSNLGLNSSFQVNQSRKRGKRGNDDKPQLLLAYCFNIRVQENDCFNESQQQIPSAIIEDIIADVELMKGQS